MGSRLYVVICLENNFNPASIYAATDFYFCGKGVVNITRGIELSAWG